ncbi:TM0106 family RecB-like putative nuclease [Gordonia alkaliphila]|uniref:TM0106 family RecB-like putative nuclease n=1 Tax=Gordonia alkaliphila TaxID=1053547 RepID=UPI001FF6E702|nr:TM0106 family RecB-like putative nuclease [Gordonia alkaliphila]MCK0439094.1 TM0106 family RecB-like putative nuclease [Gordonia alkaliphila]
MGSAVLGARDLAGCEHRLALDSAARAAGDGAQALETPEARRRIEAAQAHRAQVVEQLRDLLESEPATVVVIDDDLPQRRRAELTMQACADEVDWIFTAALPADVEAGRRGHAEALIRSGNGYLPMIIVNHRITTPVKGERDPEVPITLQTSPLGPWRPAPDATRSVRSNRRDALRLAQLAAMLEAAGLAPSDDRADWVGVVIGVDADCMLVVPLGAVMDEYDATFARRRAVAEGTIATIPRRINECRSCDWWPQCEAQLVAADDVSLVVGGTGTAALTAAGITTVEQLAEYRGDAPPDWPGNLAFLDAVVAANCRRLDVPLVRRLDRPAVHRADIEVDVDMESYGERGAYLWGTLLTDRSTPERGAQYLPFVTWDPLPTFDEGHAFGRFWSWLTERRRLAREAGKTFAAYCYSEQAENRWLRASADRFAGLPGVPTRAEVDSFIASDEWVDIYVAVNRNFICPNGKGLKRIAPVAGFSWHDAEASGEASMEWYAAAVGLDGGVTDVSQRDRLLRYNEDDVQATKVLREWLTSEQILRLPTVPELLG